jgi:hypothetical protein
MSNAMTSLELPDLHEACEGDRRSLFRRSTPPSTPSSYVVSAGKYLGPFLIGLERRGNPIGGFPPSEELEEVRSSRHRGESAQY